jgi:hypothetical protein
MPVTAASVRSAVPVPRGHSKLLAWTLFIVGAIWLYDVYDGSGKQGPYPISTLFPW